MEMAHRKLERVKSELQFVIFELDFHNAVGRILIVPRVIRQRMGWLGVRNAVLAGFCPCFGPCLLASEPLLEVALTPGRLVHAKKPLVHAVADDVVQRGAMIADDQNNHADFIVRQERYERVPITLTIRLFKPLILRG